MAKEEKGLELTIPLPATEDKSMLDRIREGASYYDKKITDAINYVTPPELRPILRGLEQIAPFQNLPKYDFNKPFKENIINMATDAGILGLDLATFGIASAPSKIGLKVADEVVKASTKKPVVTAGNRLRVDKRFAGSIEVPIDITDPNIAKILEDVRTGKSTKGEAAKLIDEIAPQAGLFSDTPKGTTAVSKKFNDVLDSYIKTTDPNDVYNINMYKTGRDQKKYLVTPEVKSNILEAIKIADADTSDVSYAIKFRNALSNYYKPRKEMFSAADEISYQSPAPYLIDIGKQIFTALNRNPEDLNLIRRGSFSKTTASDAWNNVKVNDIVTDAKAKLKLKDGIIFDNTNLTFSSVKNNLLKKNKEVSNTLSKIKNLFENPDKALPFDLDHIQAPRFGGTNAESNLRLITKGDHVAIKSLTPEKTNAFNIVKSKSAFEDEVYKKSTEIVDLIKQGKIEEATKLSNEIKTTVDGFKNTFKNTDFVVGQPYVAKKTGEKTAEYITYADSLKLSTNQKNIVEKLLPTYSNLPNANQTIEKSAEAVFNNYAQIYSLIGKIPNKLTKEITGGLKEGGMVGINYMTRPLDGTR
jgi:hypothetical protein